MHLVVVVRHPRDVPLAELRLRELARRALARLAQRVVVVAEDSAAQDLWDASEERAGAQEEETRTLITAKELPWSWIGLWCPAGQISRTYGTPGDVPWNARQRTTNGEESRHARRRTRW